MLIIFEVTNNLPTVGYMYASGIILALVVFAATYFHRQVGLITLILVVLLCFRENSTPDFVESATNQFGRNYINHWYFSSRLTMVLSIVLFFTAIIFKRKLKQRNKLD